MKSFVRALLGVSLFFAVSVAAKDSWKDLQLSDFKYSELNQTAISDLSSLKGKWVLVDVWASWCSPCRDSFPFYNKLYQKYQNQGLAVVAISMDDEEKDVVEFLKKIKVDFPVYFDRGQVMRKKLDPSSLPIHYWIDPEGKVVDFKKGFRPVDAKEIEKQAKHFLTKYRGERK
jgi:thiol-disulfide isomerase/thioredoxin